ncbi:hypothetical protein BD626DRAFT_507656 [Schizophyllum amplum]|uniref:Uncharacterized protein n=1 Tax=Schizophyllum amplum TaxID=97359 RepID=A0A550C457_9AGAR|nr:hypothetical protein BD626DRAFT_507656 [Auriculariopsis ampla]
MSNAEQPSGPLSDEDVEYLQIGCEFVFYGIHATLFIIAAYLLIPRGFRTMKYFSLLCATVALFTAATGVMVLDMKTAVASMELLGYDPPNLDGMIKRTVVADNWLFRLNFLISDAVLVWRAWVLWPGHKQIQNVLLGCMAVTAAGVIADGTLVTVDAVRAADRTGAVSLMMTVPLLVTNVAATGCILKKLFGSWESVHARIASKSLYMRCETYCLFGIESGLVYCGISLVTLVAAVIDAGIFTSIWLAVSISLTGLYSTFIIVLFLMDKPPVQRHLPATSTTTATTTSGSRSVTFHMSGSAPRPPLEKPAEKSRTGEHGGDSILITSQTFQDARSRDASENAV